MTTEDRHAETTELRAEHCCRSWWIRQWEALVIDWASEKPEAIDPVENSNHFGITAETIQGSWLQGDSG